MKATKVIYDFAWLIELGQPEGFTTPFYYTAIPEELWSTDPWAAERYSDKATAEATSIEVGGHSVEHGFRVNIKGATE